MHILFAEHLGCEYLVSYDSDFKSAKSVIEERNGIKVLITSEELLKIN